MTVFDNMAFGLKLRKVPKAEIKQKVEEAAKILGSERGVPVSQIALKTANDAGLLNGQVVEANGKVLAWVSNSLDPKFEDSQLKSSDGVYYDVMAGLSYGDYTVEEAAQTLYDGVTAVISQ